MEDGTAQPMVIDAPAEATPQSEIDRQIDELENQVAHLRRSNAELEAHLRENGHDSELRAAIGENIVAIAKRCAIIEDLRKNAPMQPELAQPGGNVDPAQEGLYL